MQGRERPSATLQALQLWHVMIVVWFACIENIYVFLSDINHNILFSELILIYFCYLTVLVCVSMILYLIVARNAVFGAQSLGYIDLM